MDYEGKAKDVFNQHKIIEKLKSDHLNLKKQLENYNGLCDTICNFITLQNLLAEDKNEYQQAGSKKRPDLELSPLLKNTIVINHLEKKVAPTHLLSSASFFDKIKAMFFNIYPHSILSNKNNKDTFKVENDLVTFNKNILGTALNKVPNGDYIKLCAFRKDGFFDFSGHSMLIAKLGDNKFRFFDPNEGATHVLNLQELGIHLDKTMSNYLPSFNNCVFINNSAHLKEITQKKGLDVLKLPTSNLK